MPAHSEKIYERTNTAEAACQDNNKHIQVTLTNLIITASSEALFLSSEVVQVSTAPLEFVSPS